ncbi:MAG: hypothetical protein ACYDBM_11920 [Candidatus Tyrphobacter sp.]
MSVLVYWVVVSSLVAETVFPCLLFSGKSLLGYMVVILLSAAIIAVALVSSSKESRFPLLTQLRWYTGGAIGLYLLNWLLLLTLYFEFDRLGFSILVPVATVLGILTVAWRLSGFAVVNGSMRTAAFSTFLVLTIVLALPHLYLESLQLRFIV